MAILVGHQQSYYQNNVKCQHPGIEINKNNRHSVPVSPHPSYSVIKVIGRGSYGMVLLAQHTSTQQKVAIKVINKDQIKSSKQLERLRREVRIMSLLNQPHIVRLYEVLETSSSVLMIMEYVPGGELFELIEKKGYLTEIQALGIFRQLVSSIEYCHENSIIHRDLKPENILLDSNMDVKLADFGFGSVYGHKNLLDTFCGSPYYASPEMVSGSPYLGPEVDIWSMGVILYVMLTGRLPFEDTCPQNLYKKIIAASPSHIPSSLSPDSKHLLSRMICPDYRLRASIEEIKFHPWTVHHYGRCPSSYVPFRLPITPQNLREDIFVKLSRSGYSVDELLKILCSSYRHPLRSEYYLLLEKSLSSCQGVQENEPKTAKKGKLRQFLTKVSSRLLQKLAFQVIHPEKHSSGMRRFSIASEALSESDCQKTSNGGCNKSIRYRRYSLPNPRYAYYENEATNFDPYNVPVLYPRQISSLFSFWLIETMITKFESIHVISNGLVHFMALNNIGYNVGGDSANPYKIWCHSAAAATAPDQYTNTCVYFTLEICFIEKKNVFGVECIRLNGGSFFSFRRLMSVIGKHLTRHGQR